jgi:fructokinase
VLGVIEIGGTKTDMAVGTSPDDLSRPHRVSTTSPDETLGRIIHFFTGNEVSAMGVACFGPLQLGAGHPDFGSIASTPKPGWSGTRIHSRLASALGVPVGIDTDVNGAALGEGRWGAAIGMAEFAYVTVGTGIGVGIVAHGRLIGGDRHPEMGHIVVSRLPGDDLAGLCPYHGACLEGMAAGPALEKRFGPPDSWAESDEVVDLVTHYLAQGMRNLVYTLAPQRIIVGGGVSTLPRFHDRLRDRLGALLNDYPNPADLHQLISAPGLGELSGLAGALLLAERAVA